MTTKPRDTRHTLVLTLFALALVLIGVYGGFSRADRLVLDTMLGQHSASRVMPADIVIIDIDQKSLEDMNATAGNWPWPRAIHGELIDALAPLEPRAIVFDLLFNEADSFRPESDHYFSQAVVNNLAVYLPTLLLTDGNPAPLAQYGIALHLEKTPLSKPDPRAVLLAPVVVPPEGWRGGTINFLADSDGVGRRYTLFHDVDGWQLPSMPARVAADLAWALPPREDFALNWYNATSMQRYSYADVYADLTGSAPKLSDALRGKIIVIGASAPGLGDFRPTPLGGSYPGEMILATAIGNLVAGDWLTDTAWGLALFLLLPLSLLLAYRQKLTPVRIAASLAVVSVVLLALEYALLTHSRLLIHVVAPLVTAWLLFLALALMSWWQERQQREQAVTIFGRFLDPRVVQTLVDGGTVADATTTRARELTLLFSDIRGFTTMSERSTPEQVVALLNDYFSRQVQVIFQTQGTLDKFIGDAIMAFWGAPADDPNHAVHAVDAALRMVDVLDQFRKDFGAPDDFDVGIGVHTGPAVVGFIGSRDRLDYTAIGDTVNLASRIEGATKGKARILVSENTVQACGDAYEFIDHGVVHVKGRVEGVRLYEPRRKS